MALLNFWLPLAVITGAVALLALLALWRGGAEAESDEEALTRERRIYADQLAEIERDRARGLIATDEAERMRAETARRLLATDRATLGHRKGQSPRGLRWVASGALLLAIGGAVGIYTGLGQPGRPDAALALRHEEAAQMRANRPSQAALEALWAADPRRPATAEPDAEMVRLLGSLRQHLESRPDDLTGFRLLARNEAGIERYGEAARAQERVVALLPEDAKPQEQVQERALLAQYLIAASGAEVSPEAEAVLEDILRRDPENGFAQFFLGLMLQQTGRPDLTFEIWRRLLESGAPQGPWVEDIRNNIRLLAEIAGVRYTPPTAPLGDGPSTEAIAEAEGLSAEERGAMIGGMVEGLSARLALEGGTPEDWARLIHALTVLDQRDRAEAIRHEARSVFAAEPEARALIEAAGRDVPLEDIP